jgi:hypothetical protein
VLRRDHPSREITGLIERIRLLVAEKRRSEDDPSSATTEASAIEIARLQQRLASAAKRELT